MRYEANLVKKIYQESYNEEYVRSALKKNIITDNEYAEIVGKFYVPTIDEIKQAKLVEMSSKCNQKIVKGCDVVLSSGETEHFSLTDVDQINLTNAIMAVGFGAKNYPYHADGKICRKYSAEDIQKIAAVAKDTIVYHTTYFNHIKQWINRMEDKTEIQGVRYGVELPDDLKASLDSMMSSMQQMLDAGDSVSTA